MQKKNFPLRSICVMLAVLWCAPSSATSYELAPPGQHFKKSSSAESTKLTFAEFNLLAKPGDTLLVGEGVYELGETPATFNCAGLPDRPIRIAAAPGTRPRFQSEGWNAISIAPGAAYLELSGLDIKGASRKITLEEASADPSSKSSGRLNGNGVSIDGRAADKLGKERPHHIKLTGLRIWGCPGGGISAIQTDYVTIEACTVFNCAWYSRFACSGISVWQSWAFDQRPGYHFRIVNNRCLNNRQYLPARPDGAITDGNGIIIDDSRNTQQGSNLGAYSGRFLIQSNVCALNGGSGIHTYQSDRVDILDNVLWLNNQTPEFRNGQIFANESSDIRIVGNTITAPAGKPATGNLYRSEQKPNRDIVWQRNLLLRSPAGRNAAGEYAVVELPFPEVE